MRRGREQARLIDAKKRENIQKINQCKSTNNYKLFIESSNIVNTRNSIKVAKDVLKEEDRLQSISGVTRLDRRYTAAKIIENGQKYLNQSYAKYKQLGGSASSVANVTVLNNPCKGL
ncbi:hypothetical protein [Acinetobacter pittii]|uniref:hypothetical protein n=1 Tax=Acinetobacter pittii TaxID=48296 RepID=UPI00397AB9DA